MQRAVVGLGYVGLVTAACLARLGQQSWASTPTARSWRCCQRRCALLRAGAAGRAPPEPRSARLLGRARRGPARRRLHPDLRRHRLDRQRRGRPDRGHGRRRHHRRPRAAARGDGTAQHGAGGHDPARRGAPERPAAGAGGWLRGADHRQSEFLRTGRAVEDFLHPARVVMGRTDLATDAEIDLLTALYRPLEAPILVLDAESAELAKNAANTYLATRISFVNELAALCERTGASITAVLSGVTADPRIGGDYLRPGLGYGGSCLPNDVRSLIAMGA